MKQTIISSFLLLSVAYGSFAQTVDTSNPAFKARAKTAIEEVYKGYPEYMTPEHIQRYEEKLSRVEIKQQPAKAQENYPLLSSIILKNKYNPALTREYGNNFNPDTFNALKYFFDFNAKQEVIYRVDDSPYIIVIHPKQ